MSNHLGDTNKMVGETPRTDEAQFGTGRVSVSFARTLERELNAANAEIEEKRKDVVWLATEKAKLENRIKRLEEAGDALMEIVEGARSKRWNVNGFRLKDTPEWVQFYVSFRKAKRSKRKEAKP